LIASPSPSHGGKREGAGKKRQCYCDLVTCKLCVRRHYRLLGNPGARGRPRGSRRFSVIAAQKLEPIPRYEWDRTAVDENYWLDDPEVA
jgi:hypothetical protein